MKFFCLFSQLMKLVLGTVETTTVVMLVCLTNYGSHSVTYNIVTL